MALTRAEQKRLAEGARGLALEAAAGRVTFGRYYAPRDECPPCALGQLAALTGILDGMSLGMEVPAYDAIFADAGIAHHFTGQEYEFPLLALADEWDAVSEQPPAGPPAIPASPTSTDNEGDGNGKG